MILLNKLEEKPNNAVFMLFASRKKKRRKAFDLLWNSDLFPKTREFEFLLAFLWIAWFPGKESSDFENNIKLSFEEELMNVEKLVSNIDFKEFQKLFGSRFLRHFPAEQRVADLTPAERVADLTSKDILDTLGPEKLITDLSIEDQKLFGAQFLKHISTEELEELLEKKRKSSK